MAWLPLTSTIVAFARLAIARWAATGIIWSSVTTRYQLGLVLHAGSLKVITVLRRQNRRYGGARRRILDQRGYGRRPTAPPSDGYQPGDHDSRPFSESCRRLPSQHRPCHLPSPSVSAFRAGWSKPRQLPESIPPISVRRRATGAVSVHFLRRDPSGKHDGGCLSYCRCASSSVRLMTAPHLQVIHTHSTSAPPAGSPHQRCSRRKAARPWRRRLSSPGSGSWLRPATVAARAPRWRTAGASRDGLFDRALDRFDVGSRFDHGGSRAGLLRVRDGHARSIRVQTFRDRCANAPRANGNECHFLV